MLTSQSCLSLTIKLSDALDAIVAYRIVSFTHSLPSDILKPDTNSSYKEKQRMTRILSYNILVGGQPRIDQITSMLQSADPDVVGLVEATDPRVVEELA